MDKSALIGTSDTLIPATGEKKAGRHKSRKNRSQTLENKHFPPSIIREIVATPEGVEPPTLRSEV